VPVSHFGHSARFRVVVVVYVGLTTACTGTRDDLGSLEDAGTTEARADATEEDSWEAAVSVDAHETGASGQDSATPADVNGGDDAAGDTYAAVDATEAGDDAGDDGSSTEGGDDGGDDGGADSSGPPGDGWVPIDGGEEVGGCTVAKPVFLPPGGPISSGTFITISTSTVAPNVTIFLTTDGTDPSRSSTVYPGPIAVVAATTFKAFAVASGCADSPIAVATYTLTPQDAGGRLAKPTPSPTPGSYSGDFSVGLTADPHATICYTLDLTTPTCAADGSCSAGQQYSQPIPVNATDTDVFGDITITAVACAAGVQSSLVLVADYTRF
jgi:hypothetical protein